MHPQHEPFIAHLNDARVTDIPGAKNAVGSCTYAVAAVVCSVSIAAAAGSIAALNGRPEPFAALSASVLFQPWNLQLKRSTTYETVS